MHIEIGYRCDGKTTRLLKHVAKTAINNACSSIWIFTPMNIQTINRRCIHTLQNEISRLNPSIKTKTDAEYALILSNNSIVHLKRLIDLEEGNVRNLYQKFGRKLFLYFDEGSFGFYDYYIPTSVVDDLYISSSFPDINEIADKYEPAVKFDISFDKFKKVNKELTHKFFRKCAYLFQKYYFHPHEVIKSGKSFGFCKKCEHNFCTNFGNGELITNECPYYTEAFIISNNSGKTYNEQIPDISRLD